MRLHWNHCIERLIKEGLLEQYIKDYNSQTHYEDKRPYSFEVLNGREYGLIKFLDNTLDFSFLSFDWNLKHRHFLSYYYDNYSA